MAYILFGLSPADFTYDFLSGAPTGNVELEVWDAFIGGTRLTDLQLFDGTTTLGGTATSGYFPSLADGSVAVWAQDTQTDLWVTGKDSLGQRWLLRPVNLADRVAAIEAGAYILGATKGQPNGVAELDASGLVPTTQLPASTVSGVSSVNGASGVVTVTLASLGGLSAASAQSTYLSLANAKPVATAGTYDSLTGKPTIPTAASQVGAVATETLGVANGVATLDSSTKVTYAQLPIGTGSTHVAAGNRVWGYDNMPAGMVVVQVWDGVGTTPNRITARTDLKVDWESPVAPTIAAGKAIAGDRWTNTAP